MNPICSTMLCGLMLLPATAMAELKFSGEMIAGYGQTDGEDAEGYGIVSLSAMNSYSLQSGITLDWNLRTRARTDQDELGEVDDENVDVSLSMDFGAGGKLTFSTFNDIDQFPWADGELFNRGSVGVFPVIRKRYDGVADSQFSADRVKVDPDLLLTYENRFGPVGLDIVANPLGTWDGVEKDDMADGYATIEGKLTLPTDYGIYSLAYNDVDDAEVQVVFPLRDLGLTLIARHSIDEGETDDGRTNLVMMYRANNLGAFKGVMLAHARDADNDRTMLNLNFGADAWELKVAGDTDGDLAVEGAYAFGEQTSLLFGWDNGHDMMEGFDDAAFPAPVFAAPRGNAFEVALVHKF